MEPPPDKENVDSTDTNVRYLAYGARLRTALRATQRYIAYVSLSGPEQKLAISSLLETSDVGEAFRPLVNPTFVTAAYGISWLYLTGYA
jgi:mitochondrial fission process protein 1